MCTFISSPLRSVLSGVSCTLPVPRHWAIKALWQTLTLYRKCSLIHGAKDIAGRDVFGSVKVVKVVKVAKVVGIVGELN